MLKYLQEMLASGDTFTVTVETPAVSMDREGLVAVDALGLVVQDADGEHTCVPWVSVDHLVVHKE